MLSLQEMVVLSLVAQKPVSTKPELISSTLETMRFDLGFTYGAAVDLINDLVQDKLIYPPNHGDPYTFSIEGRRKYIASAAQFREFAGTFSKLSSLI